MFVRLFRKINNEIWTFSESENTKLKNQFVRIIKIIILTAKAFRENRCYLKASALTFYTIFSIVPLVALAFAIAKGFGIDTKLKADISYHLRGQEEVLQKVFAFADNLLAKTQGGLIAGIGTILLLWTIIKLFSNIEGAFNDIWGVRNSRIFFRKVTDYLSMVFISPILLVVSASLTAFLTSDMTIKSYLPGAIIFLIPTFFSYFAIWVLLAFVYLVFPNTKVKLASAIIPAIIVGTLFNIIQLMYFDFQIFITKYNAIYGSFAALPLFLLWVQINWIIVICGGQLSFFINNIELHEYDYAIDKISFRQRKLLSLAVVKLIIESFRKSEKPLTSKEVSQILKLPCNLTQQILNSLVSAQIILPVSGTDKYADSYLPAINTDAISINYVISRLEDLNAKETLSASNVYCQNLQSQLRNIEKALDSSDLNKLLGEIQKKIKQT